MTQRHHDLDRERADGKLRGPLHGIPVLLKDNIDTFDMATTNGSAVMKDAIPTKDAPIAKALRDAGAIILGKAAMGEFAGGSYNSEEHVPELGTLEYEAYKAGFEDNEEAGTFKY